MAQEKWCVPQNETTQPTCPGCLERDVELAELRQRVGQLEERLEELERDAHRQAAPFRRPEKKRKPDQDKRRPGRKKGHAGSYRQRPPVVDESARVPLDCCPHCRGAVTDVKTVEQVIEDIPEVRIRRLHLTTYKGHCACCGTVRSTHPEQVSTAVGAAGTHLGKNALALAADLNKHFGITMRKTCRILDEHFGLSVTPGGLSQALVRIAHRLETPFQELSQAVRRSPVIHADETSWWLENRSAWLWVFTQPELTLYTIDNRSQEVIRRVLGDDFLGVLVSDCLASYDPHPGPKSKCCAHHLKAISEAQKLTPESAFLASIRRFFETTLLLYRIRDDMSGEEYIRRVEYLQGRLDELLAPTYWLPDEERIANRFRKQRPHVLTFLERWDVEPTNNRAERELRPAVITRKVSCGNKTENGKFAFEVLASLAATCRLQGRRFTDLIAGWVSFGLPPPPLFAGN